MSDKPTLDSLNFEGMAYGVFESAPNTDSGRASLVEAYDSYNWSDPEAAQTTLEEYGELIRNKNKDQSFTANIEEAAPVRLTDIPLDGLLDDIDLYNKWEEENNKYLDTTTEAEYLVARKQLRQDIKDYASAQRRIAKAGGLKEKYGETGAAALDFNTRFVQGVAGGVEPLINSAVNTFTDGYELNTQLSEFTDPERDTNFLSDLASASGSVAGAITAGGVAGPSGVLGYSTTQAVDAVGTRYQETKRKTGDTSAAVQAAAIETGSQALQVGGAQLVFGKIAKRAVGEATEGVVGSVAKAGLIEAGTEGAGQVISNVAENIEQQKEGDLRRGVAKSVLLGGVLGAGAEAGSIALPGPARFLPRSFTSQGNTIARKNELKETGNTFTPVTKQVIGNIQPEPQVPSPVEQEAETEAEVVAEAPTDTPTPPAQPAYVTEDDASHYEVSPGNFTEEDSLPHDKTFFISPETSEKVAQSMLNGEHIVLTDEGQPVIIKADPDGNEYAAPIDVSQDPSVGAYPLHISAPRSPSGQTVVRPVKLGQRIKTVNLDRSLGAAGTDTVQQRESTYSQKLRNSALPPGIKAIGEEGIFYTPITREQLPAELQALVTRSGNVDEVIAILDDTTQPLPIRAAASTFLHNYFSRETAAALSVGDIDRANILTERITGLAQNINDPGTEFGQAGINLQGKQYGAVEVYQEFNRVYENELNNQAAIDEEGATPLEIGQAEQVLADVEKATAITQAQLERQQAIDADFVSPEDAAVNEVVADLEAQAQEKVDEDVELITKESEDLTQEVAKITKKAERTKRKDISALEGAVAKDSVELAKALNDAADLKNITIEESAKLEKDIDSALKSAESKASAEVTKAVKEERAAKETEKKTALDRSEDRIVRAEKTLADRKKTAGEQLKKLKLKQRLLQKNNEDTTTVDLKIQEVEKRVTAAAQKVVDAKEAARQLEEQLNAKTEADIQAEELLDELESGIEVRVVPTGKKRGISVRTKRTGMDITKLFNSKSEAYGPLSALSRSVNDLAGTIRQSLGAKAGNNARISELQKRINENKAALEKTRTRDSLSDADKKRIAAAKKRIADLDKAKQEATIESRIPKAKKEQYKKFKTAQAKGTKGRKEDSEQVKQAKETLRQLEREKAKAERLIKKKEAAKLKAAEAVRQMTANQQRIIELQNILGTQNLTHSKRKKLESEIMVLKGTYETAPARRYDLAGMWASNVIDGLTIGTISLGQLGMTFLANPVALAVSDVINAGKAALKGQLPGPSQSAAYLRGISSLAAWGRAMQLAKIAATTGKRLGNILPREDTSIIKNTFTPQDRTEFYQDFYEHSKELKWDGTALDKLYTGLAKVSGRFTVIPMRFLAMSEAITYTVTHSGFDRAAAANAIGNAQRKGVRYTDIASKKEMSRPVTEQDLAIYKYNPVENWQNALSYAEHQAETLRNAGIEVSKEEQFIDAIERYQSVLPREVQVSAYKQAAQLVGNGPAQGLTGMISDLINVAMRASGAEKTPIKLLTMFSNSIAQFTNTKLAWTPFGFADTFVGRTQFEKDLIRSQALTGSVLGVAVLSTLRALAEDDPEKPLEYDIVSKDGGYTYQWKIGDTYIPTQDTFPALWAYSVGKARDQMRAGKDPDPVTTTIAMQSAYMSAAAGVWGVQNSMQMTRGITDFFEALIKSGKGEPDSHVLLARSLMQPMKGFVPGTAMLRMASRFFDNPVIARKDIASAIVEGWPGLQSAYGKPSLNIFGEPMKAGMDEPDLGIYRIFSTKPSDIDMRWLVDNGYETPTISRMPIPKAGKDYLEQLENAGSEEFREQDYSLKYDIYRSASPQLRELVSRYRGQYGVSAHSDVVQKQLNKDWNRILAAHTWKVIKR